MFTNLHIERFRGIAALDLDGLKPINLLVGRNNTGKTSVLEALFLLCGATNPIMPTVVGQLRGQRITTVREADVVWRSLFHDLTSSQPIELTGCMKGEGRRRLQIKGLSVSTYASDTNCEFSGAAEIDQGDKSGGLSLLYTSRAFQNSLETRAMFDPITRQVNAPGLARIDFVPSMLLSSRSFFNL